MGQSIWPMVVSILVGAVWILRREFSEAYVRWTVKSSGSLKVAVLILIVAATVLAAGVSVYKETGNVAGSILVATLILVVFGPVNVWWGLRSLMAAWTFLDNNYGPRFLAPASFTLGALLGLVSSVLMGKNLLSLETLIIILVGGLLSFLWFITDAIGDLSGHS